MILALSACTGGPDSELALPEGPLGVYRGEAVRPEDHPLPCPAWAPVDADVGTFHFVVREGRLEVTTYFRTMPSPDITAPVDCDDAQCTIPEWSGDGDYLLWSRTETCTTRYEWLSYSGVITGDGPTFDLLLSSPTALLETMGECPADLPEVCVLELPITLRPE